MPQTFKRADRISAELRRLVGTMVHEVVRDHALPSVSVSDVEASKELDIATVYVTALMAEQGPDHARHFSRKRHDGGVGMRA